ncbi:hypothetical protein X560_2613 [Listeria fleischmannii 1991]|uniref:Magnesium transporter MgtE n=2 Tax=Listeria fleischmannii TaxID=1069827 RepID=A0A2X3HCK7_9LIST|nr:magnesium transporter [Listeria fleischmannii]EMG26908.1 magnesium transporter [Listeria fleischmannii subsp. fleischmannii LU2006-1]KMT57915.1 hypothetical protein X560_2613 [Listeria fleischmannii 1991]SQC68435.1 Magnesium transporter mgtE [Listeria fleischmannii subsp. fleischmannii]
MINQNKVKLPLFDTAKKLEQSARKEQLAFIKTLTASEAAEILTYLENETQFEVLMTLDLFFAKQILAHYALDDSLDLLTHLSPTKQEKLFTRIDENAARDIRRFLLFNKKTAGRLITNHVLTFSKEEKVLEVICAIRQTDKKFDTLSYLYVLAENGDLIGVLSIQELLVAEDSEALSEIMLTNMVTITPEADRAEVVLKLKDYNLSALPVVDGQSFLGIITFDDVMDVMEEEQSEDVQRMGGASPLDKPYLKTSVWLIYRKRIFWLLLLFVAEAYTGTVLAHYEETLTQVIALTFFIPLLIGTGGNTGTQVTTTLIRAIALGEVRLRDALKVLKKEVTVGFLLGISLALFALGRSVILGVGINIAAVVAIAAFCIVIWSSIIAALLPLILKKLRLDPAVVSGPFITTFVDGTGLIIYFTVAKLLLDIA